MNSPKNVALLILGTLALGLGSASADASSCVVPLRNILVAESDCAYYVTAFRMMANQRVSVDAVCTKGAFTGPQGVHYGAQILTKLTVHESTCAKLKPLKLNPILLSKPNCENLKAVVGMLGTEHVSIDPSCQYGAWTGADGNSRDSMVATRLSLQKRQRVAQK